MDYEKYSGKYFSVLGDSISTLVGYNPPDCAVFYDFLEKLRTGVYTPSDTWWGSVIDDLGGRLLVNHSVSGSTVAKMDIYEIPSYGSSEERAAALAKDGVHPDVIMVYMGINDWGFGIKPRASSDAERENITFFDSAYKQLLSNLQKNHPNSEIWCLTIPMGYLAPDKTNLAPKVYSRYSIDEYCEVIRECAEKCGCRVIDLHKSAEAHETVDYFHPTRDGMLKIAKSIISCLEK